jgi:signal transduction histidine kinase
MLPIRIFVYEEAGLMEEGELLEEIARLQKRVERERRARGEAELLAERGTRLLYERQKELTLFNHIADAANGAASIRAAIQTTLDEICAYTGWPVGHAYLVDDESELLVSAKLWHLDQPEKFSAFREITEKTSLRLGEGLPGRVLESHQSLWISDVTQDDNFPRAQHSVLIGVRAAFGFPVVAGATVVAVLEFFSADQVEQQESWLEIAAQAGIQLGRIFERERATADLGRVHLELLGKTKDLKKTISELEAFSYSLSHDLRAPLRAIKGFLQIILAEYGSKIEPEGLDLFSRAVQASERMDRMILGLLEFTRLSHEILPLQPLDLGKLIRQIIEDRLELQAPKADVSIDSHLPRIMGNEVSLTQCLADLLDNAVKFVPPGRTPTVRVRWENDADCGRLAIQDNGTGIEPEFQKRLFQIFQRVHGSEYPGTGLGLAIVRKAVERMGGDVGVESTPKKGSLFWIRLPLADE